MYTVWNSIKKKSRGKTQRQEISYPHVVRVIMTHLLLLEGEDKVMWMRNGIKKHASKRMKRKNRKKVKKTIEKKLNAGEGRN